MPPRIRILCLGNESSASPGLRHVQARPELDAVWVNSIADALQRLRDPEPRALVIDGAAAADRSELSELFNSVEAAGLACLLLDGAHHVAGHLPACTQLLDPDIGPDELFGRLASLDHCQRLTRRTQLELHHMRRLSTHLDRHFEEIDQDMRLAARLQQEFLPRTLPEVPGLKFSVLYRPATWVSGDVYDIARVDESHLAIYVADAVGHGMAASLLTMFVKQGMHIKDIRGADYRILSPCETLQELNEVMADVNLNNSQFVTVCYCLLNHETMTLSCSRGGHPYPIVVERDGTLSEFRSDGGLVGLFHGQKFPSRHLSLSAGQKLILYSDGLELALMDSRDSDTGEPRYKREFQKLARLPGQEMIRQLEKMMDGEDGSLNPQDDVTVIVLEVTS